MYALAALLYLAPPWLWVSPDAGAWRVPMGSRAIEIVNDAELAVITRDELIVVDRATGKVEPAVTVLTDGWMESLAMVDGKLIAFGELANAPAAWELTLSPPMATPVVLPDPGGPSPGYGQGDGAITSLDGSKVLVCSKTRWPTVRDARTLAVVTTAPNAPCQKSFWKDAKHVVLGNHTGYQSLDITTGKLEPVADDVIEMSGKRGVMWRADKNGYQLSDAKGPIRQHLDWAINSSDVKWSSDGAFVIAQTYTALQIIPTKRDDTDRSVEIPFGLMSWSVDQTSAILLVGNALLDIELRTGNIRQPEGNVTHARSVVPRNGSVITVAEKLRIWRDGKVERTLGSPSDIAVGDPKSPIAIVTAGMLEWWDPDTDARDTIPSGTRFLTELYRSKDRLVLASFDELFRVDATGTSQWLELVGGVDMVDVKRSRIVIHDEDINYVIDAVKKTAWPLVVPDGLGKCSASIEVKFSPDGKHVVAYGDAALFVFDVRNGTPLGRLDLTGTNVLQWDFAPNSDIVVATHQEIIVWDARKRRAIGFVPPIDTMPISLGIDATGDELAVSYNDNRVLWASLDTLRTTATERPTTWTSFKTACPKQTKRSYNSLIKASKD